MENFKNIIVIFFISIYS